MSQPLAGTRVLELATDVAGPFAGKLLADFGADVIKVEPASGDPARLHGPFPDDVSHPEQSALFLHLNANKRSIVADLERPDDRDLIAQLATTSDVVIESNAPGVLSSVGLGYDDLVARNPSLVLTSVTPFGQDGPYSRYQSADIVTYAMGGPMYGTGVDDREPIKLGGNLTSYQCGNLAATASLAALTMAEQSGIGTHIDLSMFEAQAGSVDRRVTYLLWYLWSGRVVGRQPADAVRTLPNGFFPTVDGHVLVFTLLPWIPRMLAVLDDAGLVERFDDPDWLHDADLVDEVQAALIPWLFEGDKADRSRTAQSKKWAMTPLNPPIDLLDDQHFIDRGFFVDTEHPVAGRFRQPGAPFRLADAWQLRSAAPTLNQHDNEIRAEVAARGPSHTAARAPGSGRSDAAAPAAASVPPDIATRRVSEPTSLGADSVSPDIATRRVSEPTALGTDSGRSDAATSGASEPAALGADSGRSGAATSGASEPAVPGSGVGGSAGGAAGSTDVSARIAQRLPLEGIRVIDLTVVWAGPACTMHLADLGAEVIRVDNPYVFPPATRGNSPRPDPTLLVEFGPLGGGYPNLDVSGRPWNKHGMWSAQARNKLSCTLDIRTDLGLRTFYELVKESDVLVENNSVATLDKLGIGWDDLHAANPRLIALRMPPMSLTGPYASYVGFGASFEALCGLTRLRGYLDDDPTTTSAAFHMDPTSGASGAFAVMCALRRRAATGEGDLIEFAQSENMMQHIGEYFVDADRTGRTHGPAGNRHVVRAPQGCYRCSGEDRWAVISVGTEGEWAGLCKAMERPELASDARFATSAARRRCHDELDELIEAWTSGIDHREVFERCQAEGVPAGPVLDEADAYADPQLRARGFFRDQGSEDVGRWPFPGHQWRWTGPDMRWDSICRLGDANEYVFREVLGLTDAEYAELDEAGHLSMDYLQADGTPY